MPQRHRSQPDRPDADHGGRYQTGADQDRYRTGDERRYTPSPSSRAAGSFGDGSRPEHGFAGDRSYGRGGYSEEFGYRGDRDEDESASDERDRWLEEDTLSTMPSWDDVRGTQQRQSYRGRGPQGYRRSDERLHEIICERLTEDPRIDASDVSVEVSDQIVKLSGSVEDRRTKYDIEESIEQVGGIQEVRNELRVRSSSSQWR